MVSHHGRCDSNRLREFLDSPPSEDGGACDLSEHLEHCEKCRSELEAMAGGRWWNEVRPFVQPGSEDEPGVQTQASPFEHAEDSDLAFLSPPDQPGHIGRFGPYQILGVLGKGGMGVVLKAWDPALRRTAAIKVLSPLLATSAPSRQRFTREAQAAAAVVHHHVVAIFHVDTDKASGLPYLVMPCIVGRSLQERIDRDGPMDIPAVLRIGMQAAAGLAAAHAQGIVHRDVKPANILLENGVERVVLTDFGLARAVDDASLTQSGVIAGTPQYMSPEQARGESADHRSDLFSLGSVLYAMCAGRPPFRANSALAVLRRVTDEHARPIQEINAAVPESLAAVIEKLHAKEPDDRFQTANEVGSVLGQLLADLQKPGRRVEVPKTSTKKALPGRRPWRAALVACIIAAVCGALFVGISAQNHTRVAAVFPTFASDRASHAEEDELREAEDEAREAGESLRGAQDSLRQAMERARQERLAANDDAREEAEEAIKEAQEAVREAQENVRKAMENVRATTQKLHEHARQEATRALTQVARERKALAAPPAPAVPRIPTIPPIPPMAFDIPFGPLVKLDGLEGMSIQVVFGDAGETIVGSGKVETKTFPLKDFKAVEIRGPFELELKQDKEFKVAVTADDNLFEHLQVEKEGNKLIVGFKGKNISLRLTRDNPLKVAVSLPDLSELKLNGAARARAEGFKADHPVALQLNGASQLAGSLKGNELTVDINGASSIKLAGSGKNIRLKANGASKLKMADFDASGKTLIVNVNGASTVTLKGAVTAAVLKVGGASHLDLSKATLAAADVTVDSASHASVRVTEKLDYSLSGASHLDYSGDPTIGKSEKHGASHANHKE
jgi:serine/threonine-protein kinase